MATRDLMWRYCAIARSIREKKNWTIGKIDLARNRSKDLGQK